MILEIILALLLGILAGTITGLTPGIHINLISSLILALYTTTFLENFSLPLVIFVISLSITHTFVDFIPSIFLGAPDETSFLSVLPGHELLLEGKGYEALVYTLYGGLTALLIILFTTPIFIFFLPKIYPYALNIMPWILIVFSLYLISTEKNTKKILFAIIFFLASGFLGIVVLDLAEIKPNFNEPLLPLFSGLFGASNLIISINKKTKIPKQEIKPIKKINIQKKSFLESTLISTIVSPLTAFLPGLGASQAAVIGTELSGKTSKQNFLFLVGAINIIVMGLSFIGLYSINKTRTGSALAVKKLISVLTFEHLLIILTIITLSGTLSFFLSLSIGKIISKKINTINYSKISIIVLMILTFFIILLTKYLGLIIFITSTSLGICCILIGVKRSNLMGCLLLPTILFYLF